VHHSTLSASLSCGGELDEGEAEAIALAIELRPTILLIDEYTGRTLAAAAGIPHIGVLGILAQAKTNGQISAVRPLLDRLRSELRFRVSNQLYQQYLRSVGEIQP
jgi:predicted nucleic acid-binding protein